MTWNVIYTEDARQDLQNIYDYISLSLLEPGIAAAQPNRIMDAADSLDHMPLRYRSYDKEPWNTEGLRVFHADNYLILYLPDEPKKTVSIIRIMYGGRNVERHLNAPDSNNDN